MRQTSNLWMTESNTTTQAVFTAMALLVGLMLSISFRHFESGRLSGSLAGFGLGLMLITLGLGSWLFAGKQIITVDPENRTIHIESNSRVGRKTLKMIRFNEIDSVSVGHLGHEEGGSVSYHVVLKLKSGKDVSLFTGSFDGSFDKTVMQARAERIAGYLRAEG